MTGAKANLGNTARRFSNAEEAKLITADGQDPGPLRKEIGADLGVYRDRVKKIAKTIPDFPENANKIAPGH